MSIRGRLIVPMPTSSPNIDDLIVDLFNAKDTDANISIDCIYYLCANIRNIMMSQPVLLNISAPITIVGDIHGQFYDLIRIFIENGIPPDKKYLFLGDYVDRGKRGIEVLCLLYALKIKYPEHIYMIRGNHECSIMNRRYGFYEECLRRYNNLYVWNSFISTFNVLPFGCIINDSILCLHGGLSPLLKNIEQLKKIVRPVDIPEEGLICDIVWSDPGKDEGFTGTSRNLGCLFGEDVFNEFMNNNHLKLLIRGHEVSDGFVVYWKKCITVFSAPCYCGCRWNGGAYITIDDNLKLDFHVC